jgi:hypothetical protein
MVVLFVYHCYSPPFMGGTDLMNTLHTFLTIAFMAVSFLIPGFIVDLVGAQNTAVIKETSRHSADPLLSRYLKFGRITTEDGLSSDQTLLGNCGMSISKL